MMVRVERLLVSAYWDYIGETAANDTPHNTATILPAAVA
jgi:hypothetical protein